MSDLKKCKICEVEKSLTEFYVTRRVYKGKEYSNPQSYCKSCSKAKYNREGKAKYKGSQEFRKKQRASNKKWVSENKERMGELMVNWKDSNKEHLKEYRKNYHQTRMQEDIDYRLVNILRARFNRAFSKGYKKGSAVKDLGCSIPKLKAHLESKFQSGMTWDNYGEWHIDHIIPLSLFDLSSLDDIRVACHYLNLRPLWAKDNMSKGIRVDEELIEATIKAIAIERKNSNEQA
jgi:hypothetical protein